MITVIGLGFVGLTTALGFVSKGYKVYGFDIDKRKANSIKKGKIPFYEPHLEKILNENIHKNFFIVDSLKQAIDNSQVVFYCVGTPNKKNGNIDLNYVFKAIEATLKEIEKGSYKVLVVKSSIPPSTIKERIKTFIESFGFKVGKDIGLTNNPEFLREGHAWEDFINPDRIVIGQDDRKAGSIVEKLYKSFNAPIFKVSLNTAEFIKYLSNTLLSTLISFSNEMSMIANVIGDIDIPTAFSILHFDRRWSGNPAEMTSYLYPGCGFGGYCLPKDIQAIYSQAVKKGYSSSLLKDIININTKIKEFVAERISDIVDKDEYIGILGLSFKPDSDDVRETPAKDVIKMLLDKGYKKIIAYDPLANRNFRKIYNLPIEYADSILDVAKKVNYIVILTAWEEFKKRKDILIDKKILDFRYFL